MHMKINNNLESKFLKDYIDEANHNNKLGLQSMLNVCGNYPYLFYLLKFQVDQKTFLVKVSMTNFSLIKSGMQISFPNK